MYYLFFLIIIWIWPCLIRDRLCSETARINSGRQGTTTV
jgi:hypothetical protein